jgi:hypothetical protein
MCVRLKDAASKRREASMPLLWLVISAAVTAEFPQGYNLPSSFSAQWGGNFNVFFENFFIWE